MLSLLQEHALDLVGACVVGFYALQRFGTPEANRGSTTRSRYRVSCIAYVLAALLLYLVLARLVSPPLLRLLAPQAGLGASVPSEVLALPAPLLAALLQTAFLSSVPLLRDIDEWLVRQARDLADIPAELERRAAGLELANLPVQLDTAAFREFVERTDEIPNELLDEVASGRQPAETRNVVRNLIVYRWLYTAATRPGYSRFLVRHRQEWADIRTRFADYCFQTPAMFAACRALEGLPEDASIKVLTALRRGHAVQSRTAFNGMSRLLARAILACEPNERAIARTLSEIGFPDTVRPQPRFPLDVVTLVAVGLLLIFLLVPGLLTRLGFELPVVPGTEARAVPGLLWSTHVVALVVAIVYRHHVSLARPSDGGRPVFGYLVAFLCAWLAAAAAAFAVHVGVAGWGDLARLARFPWLQMPFLGAVMATAVVVAGDNGYGRVAPRVTRVLDALFCGGFLVLGLFLSDALAWAVLGPGALPPALAGWFTLFPPLVALLIGGIPGYFLPSWCRQLRQAEAAPNQVAVRAGDAGPALPLPGALVPP